MEREGESAMATGSLTTRWSYPKAEVVKHDLQQSRGSKEESKVESSTVVDDSSTSKKKKKEPKQSRREQLLRQPSKPLKVDRSEHKHLDRSDWTPYYPDPTTVRPNKKNLTKIQVELINKLYSMQFRRSLDSWFVDGGYLSKPLNEV
jgi:hypothetical protein